MQRMLGVVKPAVVLRHRIAKRLLARMIRLGLDVLQSVTFRCLIKEQHVDPVIRSRNLAH